jgi:uncharacterized protein YihD (DUF1040 family)
MIFLSNEHKDWIQDKLEDYQLVARDPNRIYHIINLLQKAWVKNPDWRLGQLFENLKRYSEKDDLFYVEDGMMKELIIDYFDLDEDG